MVVRACGGLNSGRRVANVIRVNVEQDIDRRMMVVVRIPELEVIAGDCNRHGKQASKKRR